MAPGVDNDGGDAQHERGNGGPSRSLRYDHTHGSISSALADASRPGKPQRFAGSTP
ncbi:hypothetical protein DB30_02134 [Enhygromyxa salina]|uniref:Uncharacterized protein n=1 Tax=Enhygromyxa salina TaxID=215803 RepID=A0A0C2CL98_9BACT|nr:hypothetical protein DB30_02134 [Enhygromyxa salina]